jgi:hypothetical protein
MISLVAFKLLYHVDRWNVRLFTLTNAKGKLSFDGSTGLKFTLGFALTILFRLRKCKNVKCHCIDEEPVGNSLPLANK